MKLKTHYSTFWQLIFLLATALMVLLVILCILLLRVRTQQLHANRDYFQNEVQSTTERLSAQLQEFKVVTAQLTENDLVQAFLVESNTLERWRYSEYIKDLLHILLSNNSQILSVDLYCLNGSRYTFMDTDWYLSSEVQELCNIKDPENKETYFMLINPSKSLVYSRFAYVAPVYDLNNGAKIATLALFGTCESLIDGSTDDYKIVYLMDCFGNCFPRTPSNDLDEYMELDYGVNIGFVQTSDYVDVSQSQYTIMIVMHIIVMSITLVFTGIYLSRWLTHPLLILVNQMNMVKHGTRNCVQTNCNSIEFVSICNGINDMLETIEKRNRENIHVHDQLYQAELARVEAQLYALRNQINPHFLYNTLQTVRGMAVYYGIPEIACIVTNMAYIFRYAVREESVAPIKEEMMVARKFIEIMNIRQDGKYHYSESMEPGLENSLVLRMIIQPVIENSVQHAFKNVEDKAEIILQCYCNENNVYIMIKDNGCGMSEYAVSDLVRKMQKPFSLVDARESDSLGLHNIHQRLRLRYGEGYGVTVQSKIGVGTSVILKMPIDHP